MLDWDDYLSPKLDAAQPAVPEVAVIICSAPRAGSHLLARSMIAAGLGIPFEYLHPRFRRHLADRWGAPTAEAFAKALATKRTRNGVFALKMEWPWMPALAEVAPWVLPERVLWVSLIRQSIMDQAVSLYAAELTGEYGAAGTEVAVEREPTRAGLEWSVDLIASQEAGWRKFFGKNGIEPLFLSYEALVEDVPGVISTIAEGIGKTWDAEGLNRTLERESKARKPAGLAKRIRELLPILSK